MVDPSGKRDSKLDLVWDIPIGEGLRCAEELRKYLSIDETNYLLISGYSLENPRNYVLYVALDEVMKTSIHLMRLRDLLDEKDTTKQSGEKKWISSIDRLLTTSVIEEQ